ncbi:MAG: radical SAM protein [Candidatus Krumholzibacteriia bacterium]
MDATFDRRRSERFVCDDWQPASQLLLRSGALEARAARARAWLRSCTACPRACLVDRTGRELGVCGVGAQAYVASAFAHHGEEPCLVGRRGSGTIFFSRCNLRCVFCQNHDLSQHTAGTPASTDRLAALMLELQAWGCHNVNLVTPSHVVPQVVDALCLAVERGLAVPVVYNTSAYDSVEALRLLDGLVDIYMPDFKFWESTTARRYCDAPDYPDRARAALREMHRQVGDLMLDPDGRAVHGLLVRHLAMPGLAQESAAIFRFLSGELSPDTLVNVMDQYRPSHRVGQRGTHGEPLFPELMRRPANHELEAVVASARAAGLWRLAGCA